VALKYYLDSNQILARRISCKLFDRHQLEVITDKPLITTNVSIKCINYKGERLIYSNGRKMGRIPYSYGDCAFKIYYQDSLIREVGYFNTEWWNNNNFQFHLDQFKGKVTASFKVIGPDSITPLYWTEVLHACTIDPLTISKSKIIDHLPPGTSPKKVIDITLKSDDYAKIEENNTSKFAINKASISINDTPIGLKKFKIVGSSSLKYRRKSYKVSLEKPYTFVQNESTVAIKDFRLISLSMDSYYFHMFIAYSLLKETGLFDLYFTYAEVKINQETQGIYLLIEDPDYYALKKKGSDFIVRRDFRYNIFKPNDSIKGFDFKSNSKNHSPADDDHIELFKSIYASLYVSHDKSLFDSLNQKLDMNKYMKWMSMNYFLCNADYTDEVFFFMTTTNNRGHFDIIPWDYDDILRFPPHEGWDHRHSKIGNKLIYSIEDSLDFKIANDAYLYNQYLSNMGSMLETLDDSTIEKAFYNSYKELSPLLDKNELISMSRYDETKFNSPNDFLLNLKASCLFLIERKKVILNKLLGNDYVKN
jgi:spore coat protein H